MADPFGFSKVTRLIGSNKQYYSWLDYGGIEPAKKGLRAADSAYLPVSDKFFIRCKAYINGTLSNFSKIKVQKDMQMLIDFMYDWVNKR